LKNKFEGLERITYQAGDQIFQEGDVGDCAYLLENGRVDRSFINRMLSDDNSMQIVKGSIDLATSMGLEVVAKGVER
jgi:CRP-like cAMP-binding protein